MIEGSRRRSVQTVHGFCVSILPQVLQIDDLVHRGLQRGGERRHQQFALLDEMQRGAARRARAEPRQPGKQLDQAFDFGSGDGGGHLERFIQQPGGSGRPPVSAFILSCIRRFGLARARRHGRRPAGPRRFPFRPA